MCKCKELAHANEKGSFFKKLVTTAMVLAAASALLLVICKKCKLCVKVHKNEETPEPEQDEMTQDAE